MAFRQRVDGRRKRRDPIVPIRRLAHASHHQRIALHAKSLENALLSIRWIVQKHRIGRLLDVRPRHERRKHSREISSRTVAALNPRQNSRTVCFPQKSSGPTDCANIIVFFRA